MAVRGNIRNIGRLDSPLASIRLGQETRLVVSPWAALGTDALLLGTSTALFFSVRQTWLKLLAAGGGIWSLVASGKEIAKLYEGPEVNLQIVPKPLGDIDTRCRDCGQEISLSPQSPSEEPGVKCLYCWSDFCVPCADKHFGKGQAWRGPGMAGTRRMIVPDRRNR